MTDQLTYLFTVACAGSEDAERHADRLVSAVREHASWLEPIGHRAGRNLFIDPARLTSQASGNQEMTIIGDAFDRSGRLIKARRLDALVGEVSAVADRARWLVDHAWGRYVAILSPPFGGGATCVLRDPLGGLPAFRLRSKGLAVIADATPQWLAAALDLKVSPDWSRIGETLGHPPACTYRSLLEGVDIIAPGTLFPTIHGVPSALWRPDRFTRPGQTFDFAAAADVLRSSMDVSAAAWIERYRRPLLELSGGLDSAIVLGAIGAQTDISAITFTTGFAAGEERDYARDAAEMANIPLIERTADPEAMDYAALVADLPTALPRLYGLDPFHDDCVAAAASERQADAIFTGQGGDALFYQMPTILLALDRARQRLDRGALAMAFTTARRAHVSIWRVLREIVRDRRRRPSPIDRYDRRFLTPALSAALAEHESHHPWLDDIGDLPPAKRLQLEGIANAQMFMMPTRRGRTAPLIHPLLSQPLVEACLAIPTYILAPDDRDRGLARDTFADRLPQSIARRHGKGEASSYFSRALVANLDLVRSWLLDGALVQAGLLDRERLEETLTEERLLWANEAGPPLLYLSVEAWARQWLD